MKTYIRKPATVALLWSISRLRCAVVDGGWQRRREQRCGTQLQARHRQMRTDRI